jgi:hypothetical protein
MFKGCLFDPAKMVETTFYACRSAGAKVGGNAAMQVVVSALAALLGIFTKQPRVGPLGENTKQGRKIGTDDLFALSGSTPKPWGGGQAGYS